MGHEVLLSFPVAVWALSYSHEKCVSLNPSGRLEWNKPRSLHRILARHSDVVHLGDRLTLTNVGVPYRRSERTSPFLEAQTTPPPLPPLV